MNRNVEIAGMAGNFLVKFVDVRVVQQQYSARGGPGTLAISAITTGDRGFEIGADDHHWRVFGVLDVPANTPTIHIQYKASAYGWMKIDGYRLVEFNKKVGTDAEQSLTMELDPREPAEPNQPQT